MRLENFIPRIDSFLPIVAGRKEYKASIENPTQRDLDAYGGDFEKVTKRDCEIHEVKRVVLSGFFAIATNPLIGLGVWIAHSYIWGVMINSYSNK